MKRSWQILLIILLALLPLSCSSTETVIKDRKIEITVPAIKETLPVVYKEIPIVIADSLGKIFNSLPDSARIVGEKEIAIKSTSKNKNTKNVKARIQYFPKDNKFSLEMDEFKVDSTITDTTKIIVKKETTTAEKFGYGTIGIIIFIVVGAALFGAIKFKLFG